MAAERRPVYHGPKRVTGLYERTTTDGRTVWELRVLSRGRRQQVTLDATTKTDAIREALAARVDLDRGERHRSPSLSPTVTEVAADYIEHLRARIGDRDARRRRSPTTVADAERKLTLYVLPTLGHLDVADLRSGDVVRLLDVLATKKKRTKKDGKPTGTLSANTRTGAVRVLSGLLTYARKRGLVERNIVRDLDRDDRPGAQRASEPRYLDGDQLAGLLEKMGETFRPVAAVCCYAGLRLGEALGLRWQDVDLEAGALRVNWQLGRDGQLYPVKTEASAATVAAMPALVRELAAHRRRQGSRGLAAIRPGALVFTTSVGRPHSHRNVLRAVQAAADAAGLNGHGREPVGVHDLRHSFVAQALAAGLTLPEASTLARHANVQVTAEVYAGLTEKARERASEKLAASGFGA